MTFLLPPYHSPDFNTSSLLDAPCVKFEAVKQAGVAPEYYHATSIYPEYFQIRNGEWVLLTESRMDCVVVQREESDLAATEFRHLRVGDLVALGRQENGEDGIFIHDRPFDFSPDNSQKFAFRSRTTRLPGTGTWRPLHSD